jgi:antitoxin component YwqK of YwqJK toxin-antitoxin module
MKIKIKFIVWPLFLIIYSNTALSQSVLTICNQDKIDTSDFILSRIEDSGMLRYYVYKQDTSLIMVKHFYKHYDNNSTWFGGYSFTLHGKSEGKWCFYEEDGSLKALSEYHNGKQNGFFYVFDFYNKKLKSKTYYIAGREIYEINYDSLGHARDSLIFR